MQKSMTYGVLPTCEAFFDAFDVHVKQTYFCFGNDPRVGNCELTSNELWIELKDAASDFRAGDDEAGDWCSCVLSTLGFEWV